MTTRESIQKCLKSAKSIRTPINRTIDNVIDGLVVALSSFPRPFPPHKPTVRWLWMSNRLVSGSVYVLLCDFGKTRLYPLPDCWMKNRPIRSLYLGPPVDVSAWYSSLRPSCKFYMIFPQPPPAYFPNRISNSVVRQHHNCIDLIKDGCHAFSGLKVCICSSISRTLINRSYRLYGSIST